MFKLSQKSLKNLEGVSELLIETVKEAIDISKSDFCILGDGGIRTAERQNEIFKEGYSKCDGYKNKSYHQSGYAVDLVPFNDGKPTWKSNNDFINIAQAMLESFNKVKKEYKVDIYLHWGGFWDDKDLDADGILEPTDKLGWDCAHFELRKYPQVKGIYKLPE
jgi:peptidoglycan LD-endopeptidase CwlK